MIKGILFDWHGVLVEKDKSGNERMGYIYNRLLQNRATKEEIIELVTSYKKYEPLWAVLPILKEHFKMCVVNNGPKATFHYWDQYYGYSEFMDFVNSEIEGAEKPQPEIYKIACKRLGVQPNEVIYMDDSCGFPQETEALNMKFIHWNTTKDGFREFKKYLNENTKVRI
ncbi:HAD family hydrolase [Clostridium sp. C8-1-8]|uniref:HAD family hydrolase n=1 Tax=Clostridium sp. C8-1-8 TaxID=2698831 RepID=UPI00136DC049|nr:HAD family hydrolase [Clostridium sp. C8-1-8]